MGNYITKTAEKIRPEGLSKTREVHPGDLVLSNSMSFGKPYIMGINGCIHDGWLLIRNEKQVYDLTFLCHLLGTQQMLAQYKSLAAGSTVNNLNKELVGSTIVSYPSMHEQIAIGAYLTSLDNLITLHQHEPLFLVMLFSGGSCVFKSAWEQRKLSDIADKVIEKNAGLRYVETFTNSAEYGVVSQRDFFDHGISKMESLDGYYVVREEDFVYNPRISVTAPVGPINRNKLGRIGVMSPLYTVFRTHDIDTTYLEHYFKSVYWHSFMRLNGDSGARSDRFSIKDSLFFEMPIPYPDIVEQRKIGEWLTSLDDLITLHQRKGNQREKKSLDFAWEQRKVSEVANRFDNLRIPVAANLRVSGTTPYYGANGIQDYVEGFTHEGEYVLVAEDGANDLKNYPVKCVNGRIWVNNHAHVLQGKPEIADNKFLAYSISQADIEALLVGGGRAKLNAEVMMSIEFYLPKLDEQRAIGSFFRSLDDLITLHQRKYDKLMNIKKSMLEKMFPRDGANVPEIRFAGFTDAWEQRKLSDLAEKTYGGGTPATSNEAFWNGSIPWIQSSDIADGKLFGVVPRKYITNEALNKSATQLVPANSLAIITRVGVGKLAFMPFSYTTSQDFLSLSKLNTEPFFTVYACYKKLQSELNAVQGTSIKGITKDELLAKAIMVPKYREQEQIGCFFRSLDNLITLHQRELEKLRNIKQSCLEKMFV